MSPPAPTSLPREPRSLPTTTNPPPATMAADRARRGDSGALYSQSALARPNSPSRGARLGSRLHPGCRWVGSRAVSVREPGQVRKEAALSGSRQAHRELPNRSHGWMSSGRGSTSTGGARSTFFFTPALPGRGDRAPRLRGRLARAHTPQLRNTRHEASPPAGAKPSGTPATTLTGSRRSRM